MCVDVARTYVDAGRVCHAHGSLPKAEFFWRRAAVLDPGNVDCRQALAWMYLQSGRPAETIRLLEQLTEIEPENPSYPTEIARLYVATGRFATAKETLKRVCEKNPTQAFGYVALARLLLQENRDVQEAVGLARTAVQLESSAPNHALLSMAYERNGDVPKAAEAMAAAVKLAPDNLQYQQMYELLAEKEKP
jgi:predicted Zn-dependent protease